MLFSLVHCLKLILRFQLLSHSNAKNKIVNEGQNEQELGDDTVSESEGYDTEVEVNQNNEDVNVFIDEMNIIEEPDVKVTLFQVSKGAQLDNNEFESDCGSEDDVDYSNFWINKRNQEDKVKEDSIETRRNLSLVTNDKERVRAKCLGIIPVCDPFQVNPEILVETVEDERAKQFEVKVSMNKTLTAKNKAETKIKGGHKLQYTMLRDYVAELQKTNPNTIVRINVQTATDPKLPTRGIIPALSVVFSNAEHRYCSRHIHENMKLKWNYFVSGDTGPDDTMPMKGGWKKLNGWSGLPQAVPMSVLVIPKNLDSVENGNDHFFWVDEFVVPANARFNWFSGSNVSKDRAPAASEYNAEHAAILITHASPFLRFPEEFLCWVGISRNYLLNKDTYPRFEYESGEGGYSFPHMC
ncbi:hypothetical protein Tco_0364296 [Tanacetum coccineum]